MRVQRPILAHKTYGPIILTGTAVLTSGDALVGRQESTGTVRILLADSQYWDSPASEVLEVFRALREIENEKLSARKEREYAADEIRDERQRPVRIVSRAY